MSLSAFEFGSIDYVQAAQSYQFHDEITKAALVIGRNHRSQSSICRKHYKFLRDLVADVDGVKAK